MENLLLFYVIMNSAYLCWNVWFITKNNNTVKYWKHEVEIHKGNYITAKQEAKYWADEYFNQRREEPTK
jgi:hypothetical protein